jgi:hypothetical protein
MRRGAEPKPKKLIVAMAMMTPANPRAASEANDAASV